MKFILTQFIVVIFALTSVSAQGVVDKLKSAADKVISETTFEFYPKTQTANDELQIVNLPEVEKEMLLYARSEIVSEEYDNVQFGISSTTPIKVFINGDLVFESSKPVGKFSTIAYDMYEFPVYFNSFLKQGVNLILIKALLKGHDYFALASTDEHGMIKKDVKFELPSSGELQSEYHNWLFLGPIETIDFEKKYGIEKTESYFYSIDDKFFNWYLPQTNIIIDDLIKDNFSFTKHSYFEWHYANGQMLLGMLALADLTGNEKYYSHIKKFCDFTLNTFDYFKYQYEILNERNGFNHRLFRRIMLDDTGAPALPFIELYSRNKLKNAEFLIDIIAEYIFEEQIRLPDGTLARPEPRKFTVWADDLFMSVPFLLRYAKITGDSKYYDDAANQILLFHKKLFDPEINLYYHSWFSDTEENSVAHWGRANGWVIWAVSEALIYLPKKHNSYEKILEIYKKHIDGLLAYQSESGIWHQVIDKPKSFEETSSSAMFTLGIARGVLNGWLDESYKNAALKGWEAISNKIEEDGTVLGICRGTGIGFDLEFYYNRETPPHDPRGLGAVFTAGVEVSKLLNENEN